jgi:hypothetical protein
MLTRAVNDNEVKDCLSTSIADGGRRVFFSERRNFAHAECSEAENHKREC